MNQTYPYPHIFHREIPDTGCNIPVSHTAGYILLFCQTGLLLHHRIQGRRLSKFIGHNSQFSPHRKNNKSNLIGIIDIFSLFSVGIMRQSKNSLNFLQAGASRVCRKSMSEINFSARNIDILSNFYVEIFDTSI